MIRGTLRKVDEAHDPPADRREFLSAERLMGGRVTQVTLGNARRRDARACKPGIPDVVVMLCRSRGPSYVTTPRAALQPRHTL
jgi:hypothetical protein